MSGRTEGGAKELGLSSFQTGAALMRPTILDPLFVPITSLAGVGPKVGLLIERVVPADLGDRAARAAVLLFWLPN
ncbi:hypothetical protein EN753_14640, partial [Mesorhizobium sp. M2A.F.Ca.ET.029.05.1.1]|uniref:hypothetical protein n=1 Tax=Mesorhizobium sp. M2A.F.Ca.ET.029.05.1.1 TaxID=2496658 RepID=UPI000FD57B82